MTTRLQLNLPDHAVPVWATNAGSTLDPDSTLGDTVPIVKEAGWQINTKPPARVMNWLTHYVTEWLRPLVAVPITNWLASATVGGADFGGIVFVPPSSALYTTGVWTAVAGGTAVYRGDTGVVWTSIATLNSAAHDGSCTISSVYDAIFGTANGLEYNSTGVTFVEVLDAAIGGGFSGGARAMDSNGNRTIVFDNVGTMRIAAAGVNGAWSSPSTPPALGSSPGASKASRLIHVGGGKWFASRQQSTADYLSMSSDDGDTWTSKTVPTFASDQLVSIAYDPGTGRLVSSGADTLYYSDDEGDTWTESLAPTAGDAVDLYSCGSGIWVASSLYFGGSFVARLAVSLDNAVTWQPIEMHDLYASTSAPFYLMSDGRKLVVVGENGMTGRCLAYPE